jgi:hypothetical protein
MRGRTVTVSQKLRIVYEEASAAAVVDFFVKAFEEEG